MRFFYCSLEVRSPQLSFIFFCSGSQALPRLQGELQILEQSRLESMHAETAVLFADTLIHLKKKTLKASGSSRLIQLCQDA